MGLNIFYKLLGTWILEYCEIRAKWQNLNGPRQLMADDMPFSHAAHEVAHQKINNALLDLIAADATCDVRVLERSEPLFVEAKLLFSKKSPITMLLCFA